MSDWAMFEWSEVWRRRPGVAVMGIVNVTPDSFSDGGRFLDPDAAVAHGLALVDGRAPTSSTSAASPPGPAPSRSTAPRSGAGSCRWSRRWPREPASRSAIDTTKAVVADGRARGRRPHRERRLGRPLRPRSARRRRRSTAPGYVAMHMQGEPRTMQDAPALRRRRARGRRLPRRARRRRARRRHRRRRARGRSRHRLRQDHRAQPRRCSRTSTRSSRASTRRSSSGASRKRFLGALLRRRRRADPPSGATTARSPRRCGRSGSARRDRARARRRAPRRAPSRCST